MDLYENIDKYYSTLTSKQKRVADYMTEHPEDICYVSLKNLSGRLSVSELTILRTCKKLGFSSYLELKDTFRVHTQHLVKNVSGSDYILFEMPSGGQGGRRDLLQQVCANESDKSADFYRRLNIDKVLRAADKILSARRIFICSHGVSRIVETSLAAHLTRLSFNPFLIHPEDLSNVQSTLVRMKRGDVLVQVSFPRYHPLMHSIALYAEQNGTESIAITDNRSSPIVTPKTMNFFCNTSTKIFYNSYSLPVELINLLASAIAIEMGPRYQELAANAYEVVSFLNSHKEGESPSGRV